MFPKKLRSLRCMAIFIMFIFVFGCMVTILRMNQMLEKRKKSIDEPVDTQGKGHMHAKFPKDSEMDSIRTAIPKMNPKFGFLKDRLKNKSFNLEEKRDVIGKKLDKMSLNKKSPNNTKRVSLLSKSILEDKREWHEIPPNYNIHAFYYPWYGNPEKDGSYIHWNHEYLLHWNKKEASRWPTGKHQPPDDIGSNFYPKLGPYSSSEDEVIKDHMRQLRMAGIGVLVLSWYPPGQADGQGKPTDKLVSQIMDAAQEHELKVAFHSEPYEGRNEKTFVDDVKYIIDTYGNHPALYKHKSRVRSLPMYYVYDSYLTNASRWRQIFHPGQGRSLRGTKYDGIFIGLFVEAKHRADIQKGAFDGFYTYFAASGFTYASKWTTWKTLRQFATQNDLLFIPSVGPGYIDTRVRPWNGLNTRLRDHGQYYARAFRSAKGVSPEVLSITSFNEWHEGTQIETAVPMRYGNFTYLNYEGNGPEYYLKLTRQFVEDFVKKP